jgi:hypothetical protein
VDEDGLTALDEYLAGTDPLDADTDGDGIVDGDEILLDADPLIPERDPPTVAMLAPVDGGSLVDGETIQIRVRAEDDAKVAEVVFLVDGVVFASDEKAPYDLTFTAPYGIRSLALAAAARDVEGNVGLSPEAAIAVIADPLTTVQGRVVDAAGKPIAGAEVSLDVSGVAAEIFPFAEPLADLPDLTGRSPAARKLVSAINFRNPGHLFGATTFGERLGVDFAARFRGVIHVPVAGTYEFILGSDDGARLTLAGKPVLEVPSQGEFAEAKASVALAAGDLTLEVTYFQAVGDAELQLSYIGPDGERAVVPTAAFTPIPAPFTALTAADGSFKFEGVPTILGDVGAHVRNAAEARRERRGVADGKPVVPGGVTDLGAIGLR